MGKEYMDWLSNLKKGDEFVFERGIKPSQILSVEKVLGSSKKKIRTSAGEFQKGGGRFLGEEFGGMLPITVNLKKRLEEADKLKEED